MRVGQVERLARQIQHRLERHGLEVGVGNHPHRVAQIQCTGLLGNIRCRKVLPQKAFKPATPGFGYNLARAVGAELIDHHAVVTQQCTNTLGGIAHKPVGAVDLAQLGDDRAHQFDRFGDALAGWLELEDDSALEQVGRHIERLA
ncbi:hypothetical protein D3C81_1001050 [compost metagenome]